MELLGVELVVKPSSGGPGKPYRVASLRSHHGKLLVSLHGVATRNDAESLCRHELFLPKDRLPPLEDGEIYLSDLPGLRVFLADAAGSPGTQLGRIASVDTPAGQELWTIRTPEGKEILFPAAAQFVLSIDLEQGTAVIDPPPGLLDLYL